MQFLSNLMLHIAVNGIVVEIITCLYTIIMRTLRYEMKYQRLHVASPCSIKTIHSFDFPHLKKIK